MMMPQMPGDKITHKWIHIGLLTVLYYGAARFGLLFAIPPGVATPIWPPSGISLAYLYLFGLELWPGVFLGSLLANFHGDVSIENFLLPSLVATVSTFYLLFTTRLLKNKSNTQNLFILSKSTLSLVTLVGPIASLMSSILGTLSVVFVAKLPWSEVPFTWLNWWLGDTIGVFIFLPLCLLGTLRYQNYYGQLIKLVMIPLMISVVICLGVFHYSQIGALGSEPLISWMVLIFSLLLTVILETLLLTLVLRNIQIEVVVEEKTRHLQSMNQELEKALRIKSDFLANMSHEIRTPLNSILGMAQVLSETPLNLEQKRYVEIFNKAGNSLRTIINDILDWSKLESFKTEILKEPFSLSELMREVIELLNPQAETKALYLRLNLALPMGAVFLGDRAKIKQILINLIGNAIKFTEVGGVEVSITPAADSPESICFEIRDTGIGISQGQMEKLFQVFSQADSSITKRFGGTGLGLAICKKLVELMEGQIEVKSEVGVGSQFTFTLKLPVYVGGGKTTELPATEKAEANLQPLKILLVDDAIDNRLLIKMFLRKFPFQIVEAENGKIAYEVFCQESFDLVLMDMQMPVMDGFSSVKLIRQFEITNDRQPTPIFALTAYATKEDREKTLGAGCNEHLAKPVSKSLLVARIESYFPATHSGNLKMTGA